MSRFLTSAAAAALVALGITLAATPAWAPKPDKTTLGRLGCAPGEVAVKDGDGAQTWRCVSGGAKYVFVASAPHLGNFGVPAWDALCNADAVANGLAGEYLAWLSTAVLIAGDTLPPGPFFTPDGDIVALSKADFLDATLLNAIDTEADGTAFAGAVWTGTDADGTSSGLDCLDWANGTVGQLGDVGSTTSATITWTELGPDTCNNTTRRVYCIQVQ